MIMGFLQFSIYNYNSRVGEFVCGGGGKTLNLDAWQGVWSYDTYLTKTQFVGHGFLANRTSFWSFMYSFMH
jgi:hypothetical protein